MFFNLIYRQNFVFDVGYSCFFVPIMLNNTGDVNLSNLFYPI